MLKPRDILNRLIYGYAAALTACFITVAVRTEPKPDVVDNYDFAGYTETGAVFYAQHNYEWRKTRNHFFARNPLCAMCSADKDIQVHHILPWHLYPELRYTTTNLVSLCQPCHFRFGHGRDWKAYNPDINNLAVAAQRSLRKVVTREQHEASR